jgi:hypothetical protein
MNGHNSNVRTLMAADLNIAEIPFDGGSLRYRYAAYLSPDGACWIRHDLFQSFHENGALASEGHYVRGKEI